jgi:hypothetical protein
VTEILFPWDTETPVPPTPVGNREKVEQPGAKPKGRRPAASNRPNRQNADWLYQHLTITGPASETERFATVALGPGVIPWRLDYDVIEEDIFNLAISQPRHDRDLTVEGCRILARQFRERVEARQAKAAAQIGASLACPFDLQILLPIPELILRLGSRDAKAEAWLTRHWGTKDGLRKVTRRPTPGPGKRLPRGHAVIGYSFFTMDQPPKPAVTAIAASWPVLCFDLRYRPAAEERGWMA